MKRRTVLDLITNYRRAKRGRDPDETGSAAAALGGCLLKTGILTEPSGDGKYTTIWQPVSQEGGAPGFAIQKFRNVGSVTAPKMYAPQLQPA